MCFLNIHLYDPCWTDYLLWILICWHILWPILLLSCDGLWSTHQPTPTNPNEMFAYSAVWWGGERLGLTNCLRTRSFRVGCSINESTWRLLPRQSNLPSLPELTTHCTAIQLRNVRPLIFVGSCLPMAIPSCLLLHSSKIPPKTMLTPPSLFFIFYRLGVRSAMIHCYLWQSGSQSSRLL